MIYRLTLAKFLLLVVAVATLSACSPRSKPATPSSTPTPVATDNEIEDLDIFATPDFLKTPELHRLSLEIISPEGDKIFPGQARMYNAKISGNHLYQFSTIACNWQYYLNENNQEVMVEEMKNRSTLGEEAKEVCGFTSTFMDKPGKLRIVLTATLSLPNGEELEIVSASRSYLVAK